MTRIKFLTVAFTAVAVLALAAVGLFSRLSPSKPYSAGWDENRSPDEVKAVCEEHVRTAECRAMRAVEVRVAEFAEFVQSRKGGAKAFSESIVSWYGKWRAVKPYLLVTDGAGHEKYVAAQFEEHIFSSRELAEAMKQAIEGSARDLDQIENELAVALRQELLGRSLSPEEAPIATEEFKQALTRMVAASQWDATKTAGNLAVSELASWIGTRVMLKLGVSAGILTTGAANSWWSFGASVVIGIVVDVVWEWIDDPAGDIEREIVGSLDQLATDGPNAIREELRKVIAQRGTLWKQTLQEEIVP